MDQVEITIIDDCFHITDMESKTKTKKWRRSSEYYIFVCLTMGIAIVFCIWTYVLILEMDSIPDH